MPELPEGKRFSEVYIIEDTIFEDSLRARRRIFTFFFHNIGGLPMGFASHLQQELGVEFVSGFEGYDWRHFFATCELRDFLDSLTLIFHLIKDYRDSHPRRASNIYSGKADEWKDFVERVFLEESLCYRLDDLCGVHFRHDQEFERNLAATVKGLGLTEFEPAKAEFDKACKALKEHHPDTKTAVTSTFEAAEILFKLIFSDKKISSLTPNEIRKRLTPLIESKYTGHKRAIDSSLQVLGSFCKWVDGVQLYRHGQKDKKHSPPPLDLAVVLVSQGASFIRWMLELRE